MHNDARVGGAFESKIIYLPASYKRLGSFSMVDERRIYISAAAVVATAVIPSSPPLPSNSSNSPRRLRTRYDTLTFTLRSASDSSPKESLRGDFEGCVYGVEGDEQVDLHLLAASTRCVIVSPPMTLRSNFTHKSASDCAGPAGHFRSSVCI